MKQAKATSEIQFAVGESVVYPAHGVGKVKAVEEQEIAGLKLELVVLSFPKDRMVLRIPRSKVASSGLRRIASPAAVEKSLDILDGRARRSRGLWARRAQEIDSKINSGNLDTVAEVVRDLYRPEGVEIASYSERGLYENALARLVNEVAASLDVTETVAQARILARLSGRAKSGFGTDTEAAAA